MTIELLNKEWDFINQISLKIHASEDREEMVNNVFSFLQNLISFDYASFYLYNNGNAVCPVGYNFSQEELLSYINGWEAYDPFKPLRTLLCDYSHPAIRANEYVFKKAADEEEYYKLWQIKDIKYSIFAGLGYNSTILGSISLYRKESSDKDFSDRDLKIMNLLKSHINIWLWRDQKHSELETVLPGTLYEMKKQYHLTDRELEVIGLWREGFTDKEICERISISLNTLKKHISNVFGKLNINSRVELLKKFQKD